MLDNLRFAFRQLVKDRGFTLVAIFFLLLLANSETEAAEVPSALEGRWSGTIQIPGRELVLVVDLAGGSNWSGSATFPGLNVKGAQLTDIKVQGADISFGVQAITGAGVESPRIKARLSDRKLVGDFAQGGNTARFVLEKMGPPQVEEVPRSTPVAKEFEGEWNGGYELLGYPRKVTLKLQNHDSQPASADWVIVGRKTNNLSVDRIAQQGSFITVECSSFGISYEGRLENGEIHGTVLQGPIEVDLILHRSK
jgi:hypothetical protein